MRRRLLGLLAAAAAMPLLPQNETLPAALISHDAGATAAAPPPPEYKDFYPCTDPCCGSAANVAQPPVVVKEEACTDADKNCISTDYRKVTLQWSLCPKATAVSSAVSIGAVGSRRSAFLWECDKCVRRDPNAVKECTLAARPTTCSNGVSKSGTTYSYTAVNLLPGTGYRFRVSVLQESAGWASSSVSGTCSTTDGSTAATALPCKCGSATCSSYVPFCTESLSLCTSTKPTLSTATTLSTTGTTATAASPPPPGTTATAKFLSSTAITCTRPTDTTGYTIGSETSLKAADFDVSVTCATGFSGTKPQATKCASAGPYTLSGCTADPVKVWAHGVISNVWYTAGDRMDPLASIFEPALTGAVKLESSDASSDAKARIQSLHGLGARRRVNATSRASYLRAGGYQSGS